MTKQEILDICRSDDRMDWWATILFAEIVEYTVACQQNNTSDNKILSDYVRYKTKEFDQLIVCGVLQKAQEAAKQPKQPTKLEELEARIKVLEDKVPAGNERFGMP